MNITLDAANLSTAAGTRLTGTDSVKQAQQTESESNTQTAQPVQTRKYDTVELSSEAQQYLSAENEAEESTETSALTEISSSSTEEISSTELYSYTDDQLSELLSKGEITQLQYNTEMAKRSSGE